MADDIKINDNPLADEPASQDENNKVDEKPRILPLGFDVEEFDPNRYLINYNEKYNAEQPILFRDSVIHQTLSCMIGKFKPNALLVGPAGVGKTKIVEDIARRIAAKDPLIPGRLKNSTIWELPLVNIVSGSGLVGEIERKTKNILEFAENPENDVILFIDEIHMLVGSEQTYDKIAQLMKPALSRGRIRVIGSTTTQEAQDLLNDPAFNRRFTRVLVDELSKDQTKEILRQMSSEMMEHYNSEIEINDRIITEIVSVADDFKTMGSHRPDNAITLLDRSMADALINKKTNESKATSQDDTASDKSKATRAVVLSKSQMRETAMKLMTGNNKKIATDLSTLRDNFSVIKGQDDIVEFLIDVVRRDDLKVFPRTRPLTFLFAGNSGVGKSEIAKILARTITDVEPIILNMTEYHDSASINRIIGSSMSFSSKSKMELPFDILETNPYQVILLDEFEKSDHSVQRLFMSAFDEGYIKNTNGKYVDFSKSIIIATTNAGYSGVKDLIGFSAGESNDNTATIKDLSKYFDIELLNRFTKVVNFHPITEELFDVIMLDTYERCVKDIKETRSGYDFLPDTLTDEEISRLHKENYAKEFGARPVKKAIQKTVEDLIMEHGEEIGN